MVGKTDWKFSKFISYDIKNVIFSSFQFIMQTPMWNDNLSSVYHHLHQVIEGGAFRFQGIDLLESLSEKYSQNL